MFSIINCFKWRKALGVFIITFLVYSPLLFNHFVGDDSFIIEKNTFYRSWRNVPRLFENGYISNADKIISERQSKTDLGAGSVSYRPISNLTYFFDYALFQAKAYGSHLINILIHSINAVLVYWIVTQIFFSSSLGVFAGLLFSLHPIQSEAVAVMSYRADILAALFVLLSFFFWIKFTQGGYANKIYYSGCLAMYFLALFNKESSVMLPLAILVFDQLLITRPSNLKPRGIYYIGFMPILAFYLYLYFVVFPNASLSLNWLGGTFISHCLIMGSIGYNYFVEVLLPVTVKMIPGLYCPPVPGTLSFITVGMGMAFIITLSGICVLWRRHRASAFFLLWYVIFYFPVSNVIPIANPMANRFMYLPSIGLLVVLAFFLSRIFHSHYIKNLSPYLSRMLYGAIILICMTRTLFLNEDWRNNYYIGHAWIRDYPRAYQGYALVAKEYYHMKLFKEAEEYFEKSLSLGNRQIEDGIGLVECYIYFGKIAKAEALLKKIISHHSYYDDVAFLYLGEIYYNQKNNQQAQEMLTKSLALNPHEPLAYMYLMRVYLNLHKFEEAKRILNEAQNHLNFESDANFSKELKSAKNTVN